MQTAVIKDIMLNLENGLTVVKVYFSVDRRNSEYDEP